MDETRQTYAGRGLRARSLLAGAAGALMLAALACGEGAQVDVVKALTDDSYVLRIACLDENGDGRLNAADAGAETLDDVNGDGQVTDVDRATVTEVDMVFPDGAPAECAANSQIDFDWQVTEPIDCTREKAGLLLYGVGGGAAALKEPEDAAGVRWMLSELADELEGRGIATQVASVAPGINGAAETHAAAEHWGTAYLIQQLGTQPCSRVVLLGHSHGGVHATAVGARLEEAGLGGSIALTALIDRAAGLYTGDIDSLPQDTPVFNVFLSEGDVITGSTIEQPNVENMDFAGTEAPEHGEEGGKMMPVNHSTIDNSPKVLEEVTRRVLDAACRLHEEAC
jgi:hypothetical protein